MIRCFFLAGYDVEAAHVEEHHKRGAKRNSSFIRHRTGASAPPSGPVALVENLCARCTMVHVLYIVTQYPEQFEGKEAEVLTFREGVTSTQLKTMMVILKQRNKVTGKCMLDFSSVLNALLVQQAKSSTLPTNYENLKRWKTSVSPVDIEWVVQCLKCSALAFRSQSESRPRQGDCQSCSENLDEQLRANRGISIHISLVAQIKSYLTRGYLQALAKDFEKFARDCPRGAFYDNVIRDGNVPISAGTDGSNLFGWVKGRTLYPVIVFFENIPTSYQTRFPVAVMIYGGVVEEKPSPKFCYDILDEDIEEFNASPPEWQPGVTKRLCLIKVHADAPEKALVLRQIQYNGRFSCPMCMVEGHSFGGKIRFPNLHHQQPSEIRDEASRLACAETLSELWDEDPMIKHFKGINGLPIHHSR